MKHQVNVIFPTNRIVSFYFCSNSDSIKIGGFDCEQKLEIEMDMSNFKICSHCVFRDNGKCQFVLNMLQISHVFSGISSVLLLKVEQIDNEGHTLCRTMLARELISNLFHANVALSKCPWLSKYRWTWPYFRSYSSPDEHYYYILSNFLIKQFLLNQQQELVGTHWKIFLDNYREFTTLIFNFAQKIQPYISGDASANALMTHFALGELSVGGLDEWMKRLHDEIIQSEAEAGENYI